MGFFKDTFHKVVNKAEEVGEEAISLVTFGRVDLSSSTAIEEPTVEPSPMNQFSKGELDIGDQMSVDDMGEMEGYEAWSPETVSVDSAVSISYGDDSASKDPEPTGFLGSVESVISSTVGKVTDVVGEVVDTVENAANFVVGTASLDDKGIVGATIDVAETTIDATKVAVTNVLDTVSDTIDQVIVSPITDKLDELVEEGTENDDGGLIGDYFHGVEVAIAEVATSLIPDDPNYNENLTFIDVYDDLSGINPVNYLLGDGPKPSDLVDSVVSYIDDVKEDGLIDATIDEAKDIVGGVYHSVVDLIPDGFTKALTEVETIAAGLALVLVVMAVKHEEEIKDTAKEVGRAGLEAAKETGKAGLAAAPLLLV